MQIFAFVNTNINVADQFCTSMCFESKKWVIMLVPCVLELYLELRRFMPMGKCWIPNKGKPAWLLCRTYATMPYIRHNAVCRMKYAVREHASSLLIRPGWPRQ